MKDIKIGGKTIGEGKPCFIIAELSANHNHDFETALKTVQAMKDSGADCVKLQTAKPDSITIDCDNEYFKIQGGTPWDGKSLFELYTDIHTPWEWHEPIKKMTEDLGMVFFSSPFDAKAVDFLEDLEVPAYKIASFEITDIPLIENAASRGKPMIISTGIALEEDIKDAINACKKVGNDNIILLKCTSAYPTPLDEVNLATIPLISETFQTLVGLSDHTQGYIVPVGAVSLGAVVVEKHFILDRSIGGPDAGFSLEPNEFKLMVDNVRSIEKAFGKPAFNSFEKVKKSRKFARSLFVVENIVAGELFTSENVRSIRPGDGCPPKFLPDVLGRKASVNIERGTPFNLKFVAD